MRGYYEISTKGEQKGVHKRSRLNNKYKKYMNTYYKEYMKTYFKGYMNIYYKEFMNIILQGVA